MLNIYTEHQFTYTNDSAKESAKARKNCGFVTEFGVILDRTLDFTVI